MAFGPSYKMSGRRLADLILPTLADRQELVGYKFEKIDSDLRPQQDSNLRTRLRRPLLYPLSYGGRRMDARAERRPTGPEQGYQPEASIGHVLDLQA